MRVKLYIDCDNAAFREDDGEETGAALGAEVARILRDAAKWAASGPIEESDALTLRDVNGNVVGKLTVTDAPEVAR